MTAEVLTNGGWKIIGPALPKRFYVSCLVKINETTIMVIGKNLIMK